MDGSHRRAAAFARGRSLSGSHSSCSHCSSTS
jgi:hypothetical protein